MLRPNARQWLWSWLCTLQGKDSELILLGPRDELGNFIASDASYVSSINNQGIVVGGIYDARQNRFHGAVFANKIE